jgi:hypothetical protein
LDRALNQKLVAGDVSERIEAMYGKGPMFDPVEWCVGKMVGGL